MKKLLIGAGAAALLAATGFSAYAVDQVINLNATVVPYCSIGGSTSPTAMTPTWPNIPNGVVPVGAPAQPVSIGNVVCNSRANVTLTSTNGALIPTTPTAAPSGFQNYINYTASVTVPTAVSVAANEASGNPVSKTATAASTGAFGGPVTVTLTPTATTNTLVAAQYSDVLTVSIVAF